MFVFEVSVSIRLGKKVSSEIISVNCVCKVCSGGWECFVCIVVSCVGWCLGGVVVVWGVVGGVMWVIVSSVI